MTRDEILGRLRERVVAFAASRMSRDLAEDLAQDVLMVLQEKYARVEALEELVPLSLQILRFKMAGARRKMARRGEAGQIPVDEIQLADPAPGPAQYAERQELASRMARALPQLGERCREIFRLKLLGKTFPEIQQALGVESINTIYTWDARCRKKLLELMGRRSLP
ncbi:MAG: sigma-70 family RNA polymerase sigma factor [Acidobacteria bacterium]|nr:sigma-70 family RNA polymerase sigma factor [Acidobacteriota bacterium]MBI3280318.1 sigma-70 family RNA polymerase sigma factor [Acidobacteriota bacterium]